MTMDLDISSSECSIQGSQFSYITPLSANMPYDISLLSVRSTDTIDDYLNTLLSFETTDIGDMDGFIFGHISDEL
jgi:hypothetical protein